MRLEVCATTPGHHITIFLYLVFRTNFQQFGKDVQDIEARALSMLGQHSNINASPIPLLLNTSSNETGQTGFEVNLHPR